MLSDEHLIWDSMHMIERCDQDFIQYINNYTYMLQKLWLIIYYDDNTINYLLSEKINKINNCCHLNFHL